VEVLNSVVLIGRLAADPEVRYTPEGVAVGRFSLAVQRPKRPDGQDAGADFIDVVVWRRLAEVVAEHLVKGSTVAVAGRIQVRDYETRDGQRRRAVEVVARDVRFLSRPAGRREEAEEAQGSWETEEVPF
jgi:single-strand DNA-binding protein